MTDKRFTINYDITTGNYCLHDDMKAKGVDGYIAYLSDEERAYNLCDLLNELNDENKSFKEAFEMTMEDAFDRNMDSKIAEEVIDYIHTSFYAFLEKMVKE